jgi:hypothetical protein
MYLRILFVLLVFFNIANARFIASYDARLAEVDHYNSHGQRLKSAAAIIRQDRYNYHVRKIWQGTQDSWDPFFKEKYNRDLLERMLRSGRASPNAIYKIVHGTPLIHVDIYSDYINVKVIPESNPGLNMHEIFTYYAKLAPADHYNSSGVRLKSAAAIIRQDRYNYHVRGIRQVGDSWDPFFRKKYNRDRLEQMLRAGRASASALDSIVYGNPLIRVDIFKDYITVKVIKGATPSSIR